MKLSDFTVPELRQMQEAIRETRAGYNAYKDNFVPGHGIGRCPLCFVAKEIKERHVCYACPWVVFEGGNCEDLKYWRETAGQRRNRLDRWHNLIEDEIRGRENNERD